MRGTSVDGKLSILVMFHPIVLCSMNDPGSAKSDLISDKLWISHAIIDAERLATEDTMNGFLTATYWKGCL
jgi:hypothetical protein